MSRDIDKAAYNAYMRDYHAAARKQGKARAVAYKGGKCELCGYDRCADALEFHHSDPAGKDLTIARSFGGYSWERIKRELDRCIMVCANCHRELHAGGKLELANENEALNRVGYRAISPVE